MESSGTRSFETGHTEMIHDAKMDYYGKFLATASSDRTVRVFEISGNQQTEIQRLQGHTGPVWQVAWAHPKLRGNVLASCGYDGRVILWSEDRPGVPWTRTVLLEPQQGFNPGSINSVCWAPPALGLALAVAASNGYVYLFEMDAQGTFRPSYFEAHKGGANSVSWGPDKAAGSLLDASPADTTGTLLTGVRRLVTGGCDHRVKVWRYSETQWVEEPFLNKDNKHRGWVRDVAWAPSLGLPAHIIASASEDKTVVIWSEDSKNKVWRNKQVLHFKHKVWAVSWSVMGNLLAVSQGDNQVSLWKQAINGRWEQVSSVDNGAKPTQEGKGA